MGTNWIWKKNLTTHPIWYPVLTEIWKNFLGTTQFGPRYQLKFGKNFLGTTQFGTGTNWNLENFFGDHPIRYQYQLKFEKKIIGDHPIWSGLLGTKRNLKTKIIWCHPFECAYHSLVPSALKILLSFVLFENIKMLKYMVALVK